jgi:DNA-binding beta-propeller fold protein YncE
MRRREFLTAAAAVPFLKYVRPLNAARTHGGSPLFLVTADNDAAVLVVDAVSGRVTRHIATAPGPRGIDATPDGQTAVVCHTATGVVSVLARGFHVRHTVESIVEPRYTVFGKQNVAYISDSAGGSLHVIDLVTGRIVGRLDVDGPARHLSISPTGDRVWLALGNAARSVAIVDVENPRRPRLVRNVPTPHRSHDVAFSDDGREVWISSGASRRIAIYAATTGRQIAILNADAPPQHFALLPGAAWVTSGASGTLRVHDLTTRDVRRRIAVPVGSYNVTFGPGRVATPSLDRGTLTIVDRHAGAVSKSLRVTTAAHDACFVIGA